MGSALILRALPMLRSLRASRSSRTSRSSPLIRAVHLNGWFSFCYFVYLSQRERSEYPGRFGLANYLTLREIAGQWVSSGLHWLAFSHFSIDRPIIKVESSCYIHGHVGCHEDGLVCMIRYVATVLFYFINFILFY